MDRALWGIALSMKSVVYMRPYSCRTAPLLLDWAVMEAEVGAVDRANELMARAALIDPSHAPVYTPWAPVEKSVGSIGLFREIEKHGAEYDALYGPAQDLD